MQVGAAWTIEGGNSPLIATAIHAGHEVRDEVEALFALTEADRLREEDPFTDRWVEVTDNRVVVHRSRFEVDFNRERDKAVYRNPEDSFGLRVWRAYPPDEVVGASLELYDAFYDEFRRLCDDVASAHGRFVVLDLHSYNHRRVGPDAPVDDPERNPEINVGTGSMDRSRWGALVERFMRDVASVPFDGGHLDVRENVRFRGGYLSRWVHQNYPTAGCALAVEVKKIYMDEWTGRGDEASIVNVLEAVRATVPGMLEELGVD